MDLLVTEQRIALGLGPVVEHEAGHPHLALVELYRRRWRFDQLVHGRLAALDRLDAQLGRILHPSDGGLRRHLADRKSVVEGTSVYVRVNLCGRLNIKKKKIK